MRNTSKKVITRSSSAERLDSSGKGLNWEKSNNFTLGPPFFAYKSLPYLWIGNIKSADCKDLLSDGGSGYETRLIRRRIVSLTN